jgi:hypothetical protein
VSEYSPVSGNITTLGLVPTSNGWNGQMLFENCAANGFWDAISTTPDAAAYSKVYIREYSEDISGIATTYLLRYDASELIKLVYDVDRDSLWVISKNYLVVNGVRTFAYADTKVHATEFSLRDRAVISVYDITSHGLPASLYFNDNPKYDGVNKVIWYLEKDSKVVGFRTIDGSLFASIDLPALHGIYSPSNLVVVDGNVWLQAYNVSEYCLIKIWHTYN